MPSVTEIQGMFPDLTDAEDLFDLPRDLARRDIDGIVLTDPRGRRYELPFTGYTTDRDRFDRHLAHLAVREGAELIRGCRLLSAGQGVAGTSLGDISYRLIVGADGPGSRTARSLGLPANTDPYPAVSSVAEGDFGSSVQMFFGGIAPGAYAWIIPKDTEANVGVGFAPRFADGDLTGHLRRFADSRGLVLARRPEGKYVPSRGAVSRTYTDEGMIVGDAAGFVIPVNGGGIPLAMIGGRICAEAACGAIRHGAPLSDYEKAWKRVFDKPLSTAVFNKKLADRFAFRSDRSTALCMRMLGTRRMGNLIRCKRIFPRSVFPVRPHLRTADGTFRMLLFEPFAASGASVVPSLPPSDALLPHGPVRDAHDLRRILDGVVVGEHRTAEVQCKCQHRYVDRGETPYVAGSGGGRLHSLHRPVGAVGDPEQVPPQGEAGVAVPRQFVDHPRRAAEILLGELLHREEGRTVQDQHRIPRRRMSTDMNYVSTVAQIRSEADEVMGMQWSSGSRPKRSARMAT